jgi:hypothetical protein
MKFTLPFVSLMLVGLLGSLHTPSTDSSTSIGARQDAQVQDGRNPTHKFEETERRDVHALPGLTFSIRRHSP